MGFIGRLSWVKDYAVRNNRDRRSFGAANCPDWAGKFARCPCCSMEPRDGKGPSVPNSQNDRLWNSRPKGCCYVRETLALRWGSPHHRERQVRPWLRRIFNTLANKGRTVATPISSIGLSLETSRAEHDFLAFSMPPRVCAVTRLRFPVGATPQSEATGAAMQETK